MFTCANYGATYYVAPTGSDSNPGTAASPKATINEVAYLLSAGDILYLRAGTYNQSVYMYNSGSSKAPITIAGYPGEKAVIDGSFLVPAGTNGQLVYITGSNVILQDLTIQRSRGIGLVLEGTNDWAVRLRSQSNILGGIMVSGSGYSVVTNCEVYYNSLQNEHNTNSIWAGSLSAARGGYNSTLVNNKVWNNWGEGLSTYECTNTVITGNVVYDNRVNVYLSDCAHVLVARNLIYSTSNNICAYLNNQSGIMLGDEKYNPPSSDNTIINNVIMGCYNNIYYWRGESGGGLKNVLIANNTLANATGDGNLKLGSGTHSNSTIENNIFLQETSPSIANVQTSIPGITFCNNLWSKTPPTAVNGTKDVIGDAGISKYGPTGAGQLSAQWFFIMENSQGRNKAASVPIVSADFFSTRRCPTPDMGAIEFGNALTSPTNVCLIQ